MKANSKNFLIYFFLCLIYCNTISAQNTWQRAESPPIYEIGDLIIASNNDLFLSSKNTHHVFISRDSAASWKEENYTQTNKYLAKYNKKYFRSVKNQIYLGITGGGSRYIYENQELVNLSISSSYFNHVKSDIDGNIFLVDNYNVYGTDADWKIDLNNLIYKTIAQEYILESFFYSVDKNYLVVTNGKDSTRIYTLNTSTKVKKLYSSFINKQVPSEIYISEKGNVFYSEYINNNVHFHYALAKAPYSFIEALIDSNSEIRVNYKYFNSPLNQLFAITDNGIYLNNNNDPSKWIKCEGLSNNMPLPSVNDFDINYYIKDSLNALINLGDNCGQAIAYSFTPKYKLWRQVELNLNKDNLSNLKRDKKGILYAFRPCENLTNHNYLESKNDGKDWNSFYINGEPVSSVGINKYGEVIALAYKSIYIHDSDLDNWNLINSPITKIKEIILLQFYSNKGELFISGISQSNINPVKYYLFHSSDGGLNWDEVTAFVTSSHDPSPDFEIFVDNFNHWLAFSDQLSFIPTSILISKDFGKTWEVDQRFKDFEFVSAIQQLSDNRYLISGKDKFKKYGSFLSNSSGGFDLLSSNFSGHPSRLELQSDDKLFGYSSWSNGSPIPFTSKDVGKTIFEDETGILPEDQDYRSIRSSILTPGQKTVLNLAYDGIYTSRTDIFSNVIDKSNHSSLLSNYLFQQSTSTLVLSKLDGTDFKSGESYIIYNSTGQIIYKDELINRNGVIDISNIVQGIYFLDIKGLNNLSEQIKFVKYY
ncbi:MAG: hypothetical protein ABI851_11830 [Saprospiraceae bacterium]